MHRRASVVHANLAERRRCRQCDGCEDERESTNELGEKHDGFPWMKSAHDKTLHQTILGAERERVNCDTDPGRWQHQARRE